MDINEKIHTFIETYNGEKIKSAVVVILYIAAAILTIFSLQAGIEVVFTHLFYVPIIISAYWYRLRGVAYTVLLSGFYLGAVFLLTMHDTQTILAAAGRIVMFIGIAVVVAVLSEMIYRQKAALHEKNRELLNSNTRLEATEKELRNNLVQLAESERNLLVSREQIRLILDSSAEGIYGIDRQGCITFVNPAVVKLLGYTSPLELLGKNADDLIHPGKAGGSPFHEKKDIILNTLTEGSTTHCDNNHFRKKDGTVFPVAYCSAPLIRNGTIEGAVISFEDTTERMKMINQIKVSLKEKEILLKEIHHRVKNNLQIVASLLSLQSRYIKDEKLLDALKESQNRVKAMALVHEKLYRSEDIAHIGLDEYIRFLATNLFNFYNISSQKIRLTVDIKEVGIDINSAIPIGLIINELVSNSLKYAFPEGRKGEMVITGHKDGDIIIIQIKDTGIGMPEGFDWKNAESLGLRLVVSLVEQIQGKIELKPGEGTTWELTIPPPAK